MGYFSALFMASVSSPSSIKATPIVAFLSLIIRRISVFNVFNESWDLF